MSRPSRATLFGFLAAGCVALPAQADVLLATRQTLVEPGLPLTLIAVATHGEVLPDELPARIVIGARAVKLTLHASGPASSAQRGYDVAFPPELEGTGRLELMQEASSVLLVQLKPGLRAAPPVDNLARIQGREEETGVVNLSRRKPALSEHEPMYFVAGTRGGKDTARFQLSFKYRIFDPDGWMSDLPFGQALTGLHFGYTQTSLWDLSGHSKPFRDTTYKPSFFYQLGPYRMIGSRHTLSAQAGYEHQSNGRDGTESRSIDTVFVRPGWRWEIDENTHVSASVKLFDYLDKDRNNRDIAEYRGHALVNLRFGNDDGWLLQAEGYPGQFGSLQLDLSYRLKRLLLADAGGFLHFQYFNGYGESLIDYNRSGPSQFRVGFSIVR
ncbi:MAG TPA: phospholipase A [Methyloversatilis sp.]